MGCTAAGQAVVEKPGPKHGEPYGWAELACGGCIPATKGSALLPTPGAAQLVSTSAWSELVRSRLAGCRLLGIRACSLRTQDHHVPCRSGRGTHPGCSHARSHAPSPAVRLSGTTGAARGQIPHVTAPLQPSICPFQPFWKARALRGMSGGRHTPYCPRGSLFGKLGRPRGHLGTSPKQHRSMPDAWARTASGDPGT